MQHVLSHECDVTALLFVVVVRFGDVLVAGNWNIRFAGLENYD
jgi:hypothetical protein